MPAWEHSNPAFKAQIHQLRGLSDSRLARFELSLRLPLTAADLIVLEKHLGRPHAIEFIRAADLWCYPGETTQAGVVLKKLVQSALGKSQDSVQASTCFPKKASLLSSVLRSSSRRGLCSSKSPKESAALLPR